MPYFCGGQGQRTTCQSRFSPASWEQLMSTDLMASHRPFILHLLTGKYQRPAKQGQVLGQVGGGEGEVIALPIPREVSPVLDHRALGLHLAPLQKLLHTRFSVHWSIWLGAASVYTSRVT